MKTKIKIIVTVWVIMNILSCVGSDIAFLPNNVSEARHDKLLIYEYVPDHKIILINKTKYQILESFTTFKFNSTNDKTVNKNFFSFVIVLKQLKTGDIELTFEDYLNYAHFIKFDCGMCGGIVGRNLTINYSDISKAQSLDSIRITFIDNLGNEDTVLFVREK